MEIRLHRQHLLQQYTTTLAIISAWVILGFWGTLMVLEVPGAYHTGMPSLPVAVLHDPAALAGP